MYCLSLLALALDRQVTEVLCPNSKARGLICTAGRTGHETRNRHLQKKITEFQTERKRAGVTSHLKIRGQIPDADLTVVAAADDGGQVVHHQEAGDAVGGSMAAPQHYG